MMTKSFLAAVACLGLGLGSATQAATVTQSVPLVYPALNGSNSISMIFDQFDPTLGTLTGVSIRVAGTAMLTASYTNETPQPYDMSFQYDITFDKLFSPRRLDHVIPRGEEVNFYVGASSDTVSATIQPGETYVFQATPFLFDETYQVVPSRRHLFVGTGQYAIRPFTSASTPGTQLVILDPVGYAKFPRDPNSFALVRRNLLDIPFDGAFSVTYTYEAAAVPLPATGLMLLCALGGMAAARRRRAS